MRQLWESAKMSLSDASRPVELNLSTGRTTYWNRRCIHRPVEVHMSTGRTCYWNQFPVRRPVEPPDVRKVSLSKFELDSSYASAFMAKGSFCKACSLSKLGSRSSYAKDTKEILFHSYIVSKEIFVDPSTPIADFWDTLWFWWMHRHIGHMSFYCLHTMLLMQNF